MVGGLQGMQLGPTARPGFAPPRFQLTQRPAAPAPGAEQPQALMSDAEKPSRAWWVVFFFFGVWVFSVWALGWVFFFAVGLEVWVFGLGFWGRVSFLFLRVFTVD